jgi:hypothetical protein
VLPRRSSSPKPASPSNRQVDTTALVIGSVSSLLTDELPQQLQTLFSGIAAGDISSSVNDFQTALLLDLLPAGTPLVNILGIPGEIAQNLANVLTDQLPNVGLEGILGPLGPLYGTSQALADSLQSIQDAWTDGQTSVALTDLLNIPAMTTGAFLNGYETSFDISYAGLLSSAESATGGGLLDEFLVQIPQQIAETLANGGTPATLAGDLSALFDSGSVASDLAAAFDPAAATDLSGMLADLATLF